MNIKRWFKNDKGGFGAFLVVVIVSLIFYAIQRKKPGDNTEPAPSEIKEVTATKMEIVRSNPVTAATPPDSELEISSEPEIKIEPKVSDSALILLGNVKEPEKIKVKKAVIKPKAKAKPKYTRKPISREEIVRSKLRAGMSVNQIAKATGYEKKYIRGIKKRKVCDCK